jgi:fructose/tagatose bisphosphate aldolase
MTVIKTYIENVTSEIKRNLKWLQEHPKEYDKEKFLSEVIRYCEKLIKEDKEVIKCQKR